MTKENYLVLKTILLSGIIILALDACYMTLIKDIFVSQIVSIQRVSMKVRMNGAVLCYLFLIFGLYYFILKPQKKVFDAFLFGIIIYGVYESTNYALFKKWSPLVLIIDTIWGGVLMGLTTYMVYTILE